MKQNMTFIRLLSASVAGVVILALINQPANGKGKPAPEPPPPVVYDKVDVVGEAERRAADGAPTGPVGVFDPSLEYTADGTIGWMAYTSVQMPFPDTHLATTTDQGLLTWADSIQHSATSASSRCTTRTPPTSPGVPSRARIDQPATVAP